MGSKDGFSAKPLQNLLIIKMFKYQLNITRPITAFILGATGLLDRLGRVRKAFVGVSI